MRIEINEKTIGKGISEAICETFGTVDLYDYVIPVIEKSFEDGEIKELIRQITKKKLIKMLEEI